MCAFWIADPPGTRTLRHGHPASSQLWRSSSSDRCLQRHVTRGVVCHRRTWIERGKINHWYSFMWEIQDGCHDLRPNVTGILHTMAAIFNFGLQHMSLDILIQASLPSKWIMEVPITQIQYAIKFSWLFSKKRKKILLTYQSMWGVSLEPYSISHMTSCSVPSLPSIRGGQDGVAESIQSWLGD